MQRSFKQVEDRRLPAVVAPDGLARTTVQRKLSLRQALLLLIGTVLLAGVVSAGIVIDRQLAQEVEARARDDLAQAPRLLADRNLALAEGMSMHAKEIANAPGLADAMARGDRATAVRLARTARGAFGDGTVVVAADGTVWEGPAPGAALVEATRHAETSISVVSDSGMLHSVTLAPITRQGTWIGAAGVTIALGRPAAGVLAALTRAEVLILGAQGTVTATTTNDQVAMVIAEQAGRWPRDGRVREVAVNRERYLVVTAVLGDAATMVFVRDLERDLAVLPRFRRVVLASGVLALLIGLLLGTLAAVRITQPVAALADAADRLAAGDVDAPLMPSSIRELHRLSEAFATMRRALAARIAETTEANRTLVDRQARLETAQSEFLQRERFAVSSRLVAELAHEIRNPIANLRNCLEIIRRRVDTDPHGREFADLAIDELLRMHELAEQMLDLNRPRDPAVRTCHVAAVAREVALLVSAGVDRERFTVDVRTEEDPVAAIAPDAFKQVLLNLVQNSREAQSSGQPASVRSAGCATILVSSSGEKVIIVVADDGPGIPAAVLPRIFDPFFTTKGEVHGVGLGLFVAQGLIRAVGGRLSVDNVAVGGARFHIELPLATANDPRSALDA